MEFVSWEMNALNDKKPTKGGKLTDSWNNYTKHVKPWRLCYSVLIATNYRGRNAIGY
jgi:hypothetical protein